MYLTALTTTFDDLDAQTKGFLVRFLRQYGTEQPTAYTVKEVAEGLGITDHAVTHATRALVQGGYLLAEPTAAYPTGRRRHRLLCVPAFMDRLRSSNTPAIQHGNLIEQLLAPESGLHNRNGLSLPNRVLLAILLGHADEAGAARLGNSSNLACLAGMTRNRLNSQLQKLRATGYLSGTSPGSTGSVLFGRVNTLYFLRLWSPRPTDIRVSSSLLMAAYRLFRTAHRARRSPTPSYISANDLGSFWELPHDRFENILHLLEPSYEHSDSPILQRKIEEYVAALLTDYRHLLEGRIDPDTNVHRKIYAEAVSPRMREPCADPSSSNEATRRDLALILYSIAWSIARSISTTIGQRVPVDAERTFAVLPKRRGDRDRYIRIGYPNRSTTTIA